MPRYIPQHIKTQVAVRDKGKCRHCAAKGSLKAPLQYHHLVAWAAGGTHTLGNIILLCGKCHARIHGWRRLPGSHSSNLGSLIIGVSQIGQTGLAMAVFPPCPFGHFQVLVAPGMSLLLFFCPPSEQARLPSELPPSFYLVGWGLFFGLLCFFYSFRGFGVNVAAPGFLPGWEAVVFGV